MGRRGQVRASFTYTVPARVDQVVEVYKSTAFFLATLKHAGAVTIEILEERSLPGGGRYWRAKITESSRVPEFLRASDLDIYINESAFDPPKRKLTWRIFPNFKTGRFSLSGEIALLDAEAVTRVVYTADLKVRIPLIGRQAETYGLRKIGEELRKQSEFLASWLS
jgi:hypothetical protein